MKKYQKLNEGVNACKTNVEKSATTISESEEEVADLKTESTEAMEIGFNRVPEQVELLHCILDLIWASSRLLQFLKMGNWLMKNDLYFCLFVVIFWFRIACFVLSQKLTESTFCLYFV
jgi:hypothetical protein